MLNETLINDLFLFIRNGLTISQNGAGGIPITRIETISNENIDLNKLGYADVEKEDGLEKWFLQDGDILMSHINSTPHLGKCAIYLETHPKIIHGMNLLCLRPDTKLLNPKYALYAFRSLYFKRQLPKIINNSVNQSSFSITNLKMLKIPVLTLEKQNRIVSLLDKISFVIQERKETIKLADEFLRSTFLEMFGDPVENSKDWPIKILDDITIKITDGEHLNPELSENGKSLIMAQDVRDDYVDFSHEKYVNEDNFLRYTNKCKPEKEDIVLVSRGATIGRCTTVKTNKEFCLMGSVILIKPDKNKLIARYLEWLFKHSNFNKKLVNISGSSAQQAIYIQNLKLFKVPVPDPILQDYFNAIVIKIEALKEKYRSSLTEMENQFNSLMQKAFRGEL